MERNKTYGWVLVVFGVLANNYVYLHDIVTNGHNGAIVLGWKAAAGIFVTLGVIAIGLILAWRAEANPS